MKLDTSRQRRTAWICLFAVALIAATRQAFILPHHDVAWYLIAGERLLEGGDLYGRDIIEVNPPLIVYLSAFAVALSHVVPWLSAQAAWTAVVALIGVAGTYCCARLFAAIPSKEDTEFSPVYCAVTAAAFLFSTSSSLFWPGFDDFGQRDHLVFIGLTTYLASLAVALLGGRPAMGIRCIAGSFGALALALKPHHALAVVCGEALLLWRRRTVSASFRTESVVMVGMGLTYLAVVYFLDGGYFSVVAPLAIQTYWAYGEPLLQVFDVRQLAILVVAAMVLLYGARDRLGTSLAAVWGVGAVGSYAAFLAQQTGWTYQLGPAVRLTSLSVGALVVSRLWQIASARQLWFRTVAAPVFAAVLAMCALSAWSAAAVVASHGTRQAAVVRALEVELALRGPVRLASLSTSLDPSVTVAFVGGHVWSSRFAALWPLPALAPRQADGQPRTSTRDPARAADVERWLRQAVVEDLRRWRPEVVLVDTARVKQALPDGFDILGWLQEDEAFRLEWTAYHLDSSVRSTAIYSRRE